YRVRRSARARASARFTGRSTRPRGCTRSRSRALRSGIDASAASSRRRRAPLDLLSGILPGIDQSDYLVASLGTRDRATHAWRRRHSPTAGLSNGNESLRGLAGLLAANLLACGTTLDAADAAWLRAARLYEQRRSETYRRALADALRALASQRVPFLLARGAA